MPTERFRRGAARLAEMGGDIDNIVAPLADVAPDLARLVGEFAFGDLYTRPGLDLPRRQLVTIAALVTLGDTERQLRFHIAAALEVGVTPQQVVETIIHLLAFAGNPRVFNAMLVAKAVFAERGLLPLTDQPPVDPAG
ncbi:carboxymuconolactone decarboxylase family protein [Actinokineospora cianjurensis]|uniref:4-carboxymuconolactone decarboxylase n=1 Tax=Actinokineospora cianjurensis TaxID=585224 RepID=A0A421AZ14_9PSEU|nr:carboxymuconolactone decarboxylase family protein [Actinokineospora cianjurensis]RLK55097.1 4-carboxymuconolactone decarboxylase [Actinokineospora cianjurensis]